MLRSNHKQAEILDRILAIGQAVQQHIYENPKIVYQLIVEAVCEATGADCAVIYPYHPAFGEFYDVDNVAAYGLRHELSVEKKADKRRRLSARVHQEGEVIRVDIEREEPQMPKESSFIAREEIRAFVGLSLRAGDDILGILYVDYREPHDFSEEEKQVISLFGQQATMAISNSWTSQLITIRTDAVTRLKAVGKAIVAIEDPFTTLDSILKEIARSALEVLDADLVDLYQYIQSRDEFVLPPIQMGNRFHSRLIPTKITLDDVAVSAIKIGEPQYFHDVQEAPSLTGVYAAPREDKPDQRFVVREKVASSAIIPLVAAKETVGVMFVNYRTPQLLSQEQRDVIETFAAQAAVATFNARLFQQLRGQAQVLSELNELAPQLVSIEEPQVTRNLLEQIARSAQGVLGADLIDLYEYLEEQNEYRLPQVSVGERYRLKRLTTKVHEDDAVFQLIHRRDPLYVENSQSDPVFSGPYTVEREDRPPARFVVREDIQSTAAIPLRTGTETVGLMFASYRTPQLFTAGQREIIELFANHAAIAIHNSRLFNRSLRQKDELEVLNEVGQILTSGIRLRQDEILQMIYEQTGRLMDAGHMLIALYDQAADEYSYGLIMEDGVRTQVGQENWSRDWARKRRTGEIIRTRQPLLHRTKTQARRWYFDTYGVEDAGKISCSFLGVPMIAGERVLGVIAVRDPQKENVYNENDMRILSSIASQAAIALDNASLFYEINHALERRVQALRALNEVGQTLTSGIRLKESEVLDLIRAQASKLMPMENMYIALYDETTDTVRFELVMQQGERLPDEWFQPGSDSGWAPRSGGAGRTEEVIRTKKAIFHNTKAKGEAWYAQAGHKEYVGETYASWIGVPMLVGVKLLGVIAGYHPELDYAFDENDLQILTTLASQAAIALDNANLYYDVNQALSALNEVGQMLTSGIRLQESEILELIRVQASRLMPMENMYIALYDETTDTVRFGLVMQQGERLPDEWFQPDSDSRWAPRSGGAGRTEEIIHTKKAIFHNTKAEGEAWYAQAGHKEYIGHVSGSWIGVPMVVGEKLLGVIAAYHPELDYAFDENDFQMLTTLASQAAIALDNANLYYDVNRKLERRIEQIQTVQRVTNAIRTYEELPDLLRSIIDVSLPPLQAEAGTIRLLDETTNELVAQAVKGPIEEKQHERICLSRGITGQAAREGRSIYVPDTDQDERYLDYLSQMRSELAIPLIVGGEVIGVFNVEDPLPDAFDKETRQLAALIADQVAIVIQNAQRYAKARDELVATKQVSTLGTATAALQHRINNTLNIILPNINRLRRRLDLSDETIQEILDIIERNARNTSQYVNRIQEPLKETEFQAVDINASLRDALACVHQYYQGQVGWRPVEVIQNLDDSLPLISASVGQITEIFCNLIENGCRAMGPGGGTLTVVSRRVDGWLEVKIQDTGPGIPPEILDRIFTKPVPSKQPGRVGQGTGLGLWLSALLLQRYSGVIRVDDTGPDGTTMLVRLPTSSSWAPV